MIRLITLSQDRAGLFRKLIIDDRYIGIANLIKPYALGEFINRPKFPI